MSDKLFATKFWIEKYIQLLLIPLQQRKLGIDWANTGITYSVLNSGKENYHLKISLPYAKQHLTCEMYFNTLYPELGPDLIIDEKFYPENKDLKNFASSLPSLTRWNPTIITSLLDVLNELLQIYKQNQIKILESYTETLVYEYNLLLKILPPENLEINLINGAKEPEVQLFLKLQIDLPKTNHNNRNLTNTEVLLQLHCFGPTYSNIIPELFLSSHLKKVIEDADDFSIHPYNKTQHIVDYAIEIKKNFTEKVSTILKSFEKRKIFIAALLVLQGATVLEYDIMTYRKISLLIRYSDFYFILSFLLPKNFPNEQFIMKIHSISNLTEVGEVLSQVIKNFPYNQSWEPKLMIAKAMDHIIKNEIPKFYKESIKNRDKHYVKMQ